MREPVPWPESVAWQVLEDWREEARIEVSHETLLDVGRDRFGELDETGRQALLKIQDR
jgi:hypothetical protein